MTHHTLDINAAVASGKAWLLKAFRFTQKVKDLNRDPFESYWKIKICLGTNNHLVNGVIIEIIKKSRSILKRITPPFLQVLLTTYW